LCGYRDVSELKDLPMYSEIESQAKNLLAREGVFSLDKNGFPRGLKFGYIFENQAAFSRAGYDVSVLQKAIANGRDYLNEEEASAFVSKAISLASTRCANRKISSGAFSLNNGDLKIKA
jgi:hypothetical protein